MRKYTFIIVAVLGILAQEMWGQEFRYQKGTLKLPYVERIYNAQANGESALVVYLHPRSARGHKNETQEKVSAFKMLDHYLDSVNMKAVLVAPQCEDTRHWNEYSAPIGKYLSDVVKDFIDDYANKHNIDKKRIFVMGESFGGSGVWRLVTDYPGYFAGAIPAVCSPKLDRLKSFVSLKKAAKTPLCVVVGEKDEVYGPNVMNPFVEELERKKCNLKYLILPGATHYNACNKPFPNEALDWIFSHQLKQK